MNDEFMGTTEYVVESFHDLLAGETGSPSTSDSSRGSHHPSHECFMVGTPEGQVESIHEEEATPTNDLDDEVEGGIGAPPLLRVKQLKAWHQELEEARLQLEQETRGARARDRAPWRWWARMCHSLRCEPKDHRG